MPKSPHILLIVLDTLRRDRLSAYGYRTPVSGAETSRGLDAFAADSTIFDRAIAPAQWTIPAHASLFTGQYPSTHGVTQANSVLGEQFPTLAQRVQAAGYHTAAFCNNPLVSVINHGLQRGFDHFFNYAGASTQRPSDMTRSALRRALAERFRRFAMSVQNRFATNDDLFRLSLHPLLTPLWSRYVNFKGHTGRSLQDAADYWQAHKNDDQPLFMFLNLMGSHLPYRPPQDALRRVAPDVIGDKRAYQFMNAFNADAAAWGSPPEQPFTDWQRRTLDAFYDAEIAEQDAHVGRMLETLGANGGLDNALVIVTADHGEALGDHGFFGHGFVVYQELVHVPLIVRYPDAFPQGKRVRANVSTRRVFDTVLDVLPHPSQGESEQLASLRHATNGRPDPEGDVTFAEAFPPETFLKVLRHRSPAVIDRLRLRLVRRGVYAGDHKLTTAGDQIEALYDVAADPNEVRDLSTQADQRPRAAELHRRLTAFTQAQQSTPAAQGEIDDQVVEHLRSLGYVD